MEMFSEKLGKEINELVKEFKVERFLELVNETNASKRSEILKEARNITKKFFGNKVGMLAPLYLDNHCVNDCHYCGMRKSNTGFKRRRLTAKQLIEEIEIINSFGYRNVELVSGQLSVNNLINLLRLVKEKVEGSVAVYFGTQTIEEYGLLKNIGVDILFQWQETYNQEQYCKLHPAMTVKNNFKKRVDSLNLALQYELRNFAIGILFGLAPWKEDVLKTIIHGKYLEKMGAKIAVIGTPRFQPALGAIIQEAPFPVSDDDYIYACALYRLAFPKTHVFVSTREPDHIRQLQLKFYGTLTNAECSTDVLGYHKLRTNSRIQQQFVHESPTTESVVALVSKLGKQIDYTVPIVR
jgi:2-iminoacetate synthase